MRIIITEYQLKRLILETKTVSPCPDKVKEDSLITIDDVKNGKIMSLEYCNSSEKSAIVFVQKKLKSLGFLQWDGTLGYFGKKTLNALCDFLGYEECDETIKIGKKTLEKLETNSTKPKDKEDKKDLTDKEKAEKLFNQLSTTQKILVCTLLGEAGGEKNNPYKSMLAVGNVLLNRSESNHLNYGTTLKDQALAKKQFSMWNKYNSGGETLEDVYRKFKQHTQMENAISIVKNIESSEDVTKGAKFYYASYVSPDWSKETDTTIWVPTVTIGTHKFGNVVKKQKKKKN
jgi:spore germination cell wall hydrolase CwlJ-like protein